MLAFGPDSYPISGARMALDAAPRRRLARDQASDPISALRELVASYCPPDRMAEIDQAIEALVSSINRANEEAAEREELERLAEIGKRAEESGDRRGARASDSAMTPQKIHRLVCDAAARRQAATDSALGSMFPTLGRIGQSWGRE